MLNDGISVMTQNFKNSST